MNLCSKIPVERFVPVMVSVACGAVVEIFMRREFMCLGSSCLLSFSLLLVCVCVAPTISISVRPCSFSCRCDSF